jgi:hypothetical protein
VAVSGAELAGPVRAEFPSSVTLSGAVSADSKSADAAKALIKFVTAPTAIEMPPRIV